MSINWSDLQTRAQEAPDYTPVPQGKYKAKCVGAEAKTSSTGKPMIMARFQIVDGPYAKKTFINNFTLTTDNPTALKFWFSDLGALGVDANFFAVNPTIAQIAGQLAQLGREAWFNLSVKAGQKGPMQDVGAIEPIMGGGSVAPSQAPAPEQQQQTSPAPAASNGAPEVPF